MLGKNFGGCASCFDLAPYGVLGRGLRQGTFYDFGRDFVGNDHNTVDVAKNHIAWTDENIPNFYWYAEVDNP